ncbi:hypothetical protein SAMN05443429_103193 [Cruoricaptor ignavus]|uniref:Uncharacterized protein n=1 Tax=Cruoricaptor ignavus TaxID=1118202 RepID=A0A1M6DCB0_9FLAO|nr:hypothetical protein [Cruoricaptor ignavus]SHI70819.1 hypothetical protein SAMN05443429_103193 [Cruoricaptor ignavus]
MKNILLQLKLASFVLLFSLAAKAQHSNPTITIPEIDTRVFIENSAPTESEPMPMPDLSVPAQPMPKFQSHAEKFEKLAEEVRRETQNISVATKTNPEPDWMKAIDPHKGKIPFYTVVPIDSTHVMQEDGTWKPRYPDYIPGMNNAARHAKSSGDFNFAFLLIPLALLAIGTLIWFLASKNKKQNYQNPNNNTARCSKEFDPSRLYGKN